MQEGDLMSLVFRQGARPPAVRPEAPTVPLSATYPAHHPSGNRRLSREDAQRHVNAMLGLDAETLRKGAEPAVITGATARVASPNTLPRALSPEQRHVNAQLGLSEADYLKFAV